MTDDATAMPLNGDASDAVREVTIRNCNSIDEARISLRKGSLNIKFGPNGIGKSTIANALRLHTQADGTLDELVPFKYRGEQRAPRPSIEGAEWVERVLTFDDTYVAQFTFQRDEVLKDSFEVFINTPEYKEGLAQIEAMFTQLKSELDSRADLDSTIHNFTTLRDTFNVTKSGQIAKNSKGFKGLGAATKLQNIPAELEGFTDFLKSDDPASWITWQAKGTTFLDSSGNCPFCAAIQVDKQTARQVSKEFETAAVRNFSALRSVIDDLGIYFADDTAETLQKLLSSISEVSPEQESFLASLRSQIETLLLKFQNLRSLSFHALRDEDDVAKKLESLEIDLEYLPHLAADSTRAIVESLNQQLSEVAAKMTDVRRSIGEQKSRVRRLISLNQEAINEFLRSAGYRYRVVIQPTRDSYRMLLEHEDSAGHIEAASKHLSYGERNAFALVLFMHHVKRENPDLVVLDDPVSSFDKTKKFAIIHQLFQGKNSLRGTTSLLLTHDIEPAIDVVRTGTARKFESAAPVAHFLSAHSGVVTERPINRDDIRTFSEVCDENVRTASDIAIKLIYLRRRFEIHGSKDAEYDLLSSLLHLRDAPTKQATSSEDERILSAEEVALATSAITKHIADFDYSRVLAELRNSADLQARFKAVTSGYEKVQLFRILLKLHPAELEGDDVFSKFVNETYHIENEYVMQLNPREFDAVPEYVVKACTDLVETLSPNSSN